MDVNHTREINFFKGVVALFEHALNPLHIHIWARGDDEGKLRMVDGKCFVGGIFRLFVTTTHKGVSISSKSFVLSYI
jgi:hypothetical protein